MLIIKYIIACFTISWVITNWINLIALFFGKLNLTNYICQKCITFWFTVFITTVNNFNFFNILFISSASAFLAYIYTTKFEE